MASLDASEVIKEGQEARRNADRFYKLMRQQPRCFEHVLRYVEWSAKAEESYLKLARIRKDMGL